MFIFYTFIDGSKYIPKCKNKKPSDIEINIIKQSLYKYTLPRGIDHGFIGKIIKN